MTSESRADGRLDETAVKRRISFVIEEARHGMKTKDHAIGISLRVASNFYCIGRDGQSWGVKMRCRQVSRAALDGRDGDRHEWHDATRNEHWMPIQDVWEHIIENKHTVTVGEVAALLIKYGMVVVTNDEDKILRGIKEYASPEDRYCKAKIEIMIERGNEWVERSKLTDVELAALLRR